MTPLPPSVSCPLPQSSDAHTEVLERALRVVAWMALHGRANEELNERCEEVLGRAASLRLPSRTRWGSMAAAVSALLEVKGGPESRMSSAFALLTYQHSHIGSVVVAAAGRGAASVRVRGWRELLCRGRMHPLSA